MSIFLKVSLIWLLAFVAYLVFMAWLQANGYLSGNVVELWSRAILQMDGPSGFKSSDAIYPPLPLLLVMLAHAAFGSEGVPLPHAVTASVAALMATSWYANFRDRGKMNVVLATTLALLLASHPAVLFSLSRGPELALLCLGTWVFTRGMVHLRLSGNAPDMMKVAIGLLIVGLSSTSGLLLAVASLPFLAIAARPSVFLSSPVGYLFAIVFPVAAAIGSLSFVSVIFDTPLIPEPDPTGYRATDSYLLLSLLALGLPILAACLRLRRTPAYFVPILASGACIIAAALFHKLLNVEFDPLIVSVPLVVVTAVAIRFWPPGWSRATVSLAAVAGSWLAGAALIAQSDQPEPSRWFAAVTGNNMRSVSSAKFVADLIRGQDGIFIDAERSPDLVVELGSIEGMIVAGAPRFELTIMGGRLDEEIIVARKSTNAAVTKDRVLSRFPDIAAEPPPGYRYRYKSAEWIILERGDV